MSKIAHSIIDNTKQLCRCKHLNLGWYVISSARI